MKVGPSAAGTEGKRHDRIRGLFLETAKGDIQTVADQFCDRFLEKEKT